MEYAQWWEPHLHWFWIVLCLFMILMLVCAAYRIRRAGGSRWGTGRRTLWVPFGCCAPRRGPTAGSRIRTWQQVLDRRYAAGEIKSEEYEQIKRDIESRPPETGP